MVSECFVKETHVYATRQSTNLCLDVYRTTETKAPGPILLWFHGGYLITGSRIAIPSWLLRHAFRQGWTVVSPDYRVLPESAGLAIAEDLQSSYQWVAKSLNSLHLGCDADQIILGGSSAGGWCAVVTALQLSGPVPSPQAQRLPPPRALLLIYPMVDIGSDKWAESVSLPGADVDVATKQHLLQDIPTRIAQQNISLGEDFPKSKEELRTRKRLPLLYSIMEGGLFLDYLTGVPGFAQKRMRSGLDSLLESDSHLTKLFPLSCEFSSAYPATGLVHGTADEAVSCGESKALVCRLQAAGAPVKYFPEPSADHAFDLGWEEPNETLARALQALQEFLDADSR